MLIPEWRLPISQRIAIPSGACSRRPGALLGLRSRADGMALDAAGRLYVATAAGIQVIDSRGGHVGIIRVPSVARNVAFGGPGRRTLYMTALESLYTVPTLSQGPPGRSK